MILRHPPHAASSRVRGIEMATGIGGKGNTSASGAPGAEIMEEPWPVVGRLLENRFISEAMRRERSPLVQSPANVGSTFHLRYRRRARHGEREPRGGGARSANDATSVRGNGRRPCVTRVCSPSQQQCEDHPECGRRRSLQAAYENACSAGHDRVDRKRSGNQIDSTCSLAGLESKVFGHRSYLRTKRGRNSFPIRGRGTEFVPFSVSRDQIRSLFPFLGPNSFPQTA